MSHYKCRPKYWSEIKDTEDQAGVKFHKWSEFNNQINDLADIQFSKDIIVNFVNIGFLSNYMNIEDSEGPFEMTQFLEERSGCESNLEEVNIYDAIITVTAHDIFQKKTSILKLKLECIVGSILIGINFNFMMFHRKYMG